LHYVLSHLLHSNKEEITVTTETTYTLRLREAEAAVAVARGALGRDLAAIAGQTWAKRIRDGYDARALVDRIDELARDASFMESIHAAADRAREARGRGRGRPKKTEKPVKSAPAKTPGRVTTETMAAE
jgi:hypothetical protein